MKTFLYLDDIRNPFLLLPDEILNNFRVCLVRNFEEFREFIGNNGIPEYISFDHDLAPEHYTPEFFWSDYDLSKKYQESVKGKYKFKTGEGCADWIDHLCESHSLPVSNYLVHSANPVGADWIRSVLYRWKEVGLNDLHAQI